MSSDRQVLDDLIADLIECQPHDVIYAGDLVRKLLDLRENPINPEVDPTVPTRLLDPEYLDRLEAGVHPEHGDMVTTRWRFAEGGDEGKVAIWQVRCRGDDVVALIRIARSSMQAGQEAKPSDVSSS